MTFRRRRPAVAWIVIIAVLVVGAVLVGRMMRAPLHVRAPVPSQARTTVQVYFVRVAPHRTVTLAVVHRRVPLGPADELEAAALRALLEGPTRGERSHGVATEIPSGTVLRGVTLQSGLATVDLGVSFAQGGGSSTMLARVWQIVYTATQFPHVESVQLLIGGRHVDTLGGEGLMIGAPLRRPGSMPTF